MALMGALFFLPEHSDGRISFSVEMMDKKMPSSVEVEGDKDGTLPENCWKDNFRRSQSSSE